MLVQCELCSADHHSTEELHRHFGSHFTPGQCKYCHKQLILIDGQSYVLQLHNQLNCNQNCSRNTSADNFCEIKTEIEEIEPDILANDTLNGSSLGYEQKSSDDEEQHDETEYVEIQPFKMIECGGIRIESENKLESGSKAILGKTATTEAIKQDSDKKTLKTIKANQLQLRFHCEICGEDFCKNHTLPSEQIAVKSMNVRKFKCSICSKYLLTERTLRSHMRVHDHTTSQILSKDKMDQPTNKIISLSEEECKQYPPEQINTTATGERFLKKFKCTICNGYFMNQRNLTLHLKDHEERAKHVLTSDEMARLPPEQILISSTGEMYARRYKCSICNKHYISNKSLNIHMRCHKRVSSAKKLTDEDLKDLPADRISILKTGEKVLREQKCELCGKYVLTKDSLRVHMNGVHEYKKKKSEKPRLLTDEESKQYPLNQVSITSNGEIYLLQYQCDICKKYILTKHTLGGHMRDVHCRKAQTKPIENHICDRCGKEFKGIGALNAHKWTHSNTQRFICSYCGKGLQNKHTLQEHTNMHTGLKPFKCIECGKTFGKKKLLFFHRRVHTGEKPFKCDQEGCERAYAHGSDLNRHLYGAHRIYKRKFECQLCPRIFHEKRLLTKHMLTHEHD